MNRLMKTEYLHVLLGQKRSHNSIIRLARLIKQSGIKFDAIAYRGHSGSLIAAPLAFILKKSLILVRKPSDARHSPFAVEGCTKKNCRYIIVDDFICNGHTVEAIREEIDEHLTDPIPLGVFLVGGLYYCDKQAVKFHEWSFPVYSLKHKTVIQPIEQRSC